MRLENLAWFITLEIDLYNFGIIYQESLAQSTKRPWLGALALRRSRAGKPGPEGPVPKGPSYFQRRSVRGNAKIVKGTSTQNEPCRKFRQLQ